jgi:hypothetical protein
MTTVVPVKPEAGVAWSRLVPKTPIANAETRNARTNFPFIATS